MKLYIDLAWLNLS